MTDSYKYLLPTGVVVPDTSQTLTGVEDEWQAAFGADIVVTADTPQGVMITAETLARNNVIRNNAALANQINPNIAGGAFLDAIMALTGVQRTAQTQTTVSEVTVTGVAGTVIPVGAQARTDAGDIFSITEATTIPDSGTTSATFKSNEYGPIPCAEDELTNIVTGIIGWETVTNPIAGVLGATTQSDQEARAFRLNTLAFNGISLAEAITSALYNVEGVKSLTFQENVAATVQTINGISMLPHSVYACIDGGENVDVAAALLENKSSGASWNGGTNVNVLEPASGQVYEVLFDRPDEVSILVRVTTTNGSANDIIQSVLKYAAGLISITDQEGIKQTLAGFVVGADVSPFDIAAAVTAENPGIYISNLEIGLAPSGEFGNAPIAIGVDQIASTEIGFISVVIT